MLPRPHLLALASAAALIAACSNNDAAAPPDRATALLAGSALPATDPCDVLACAPGVCDPVAVRCTCPPGHAFDGLACVAVPACETSADCPAAEGTCFASRCDDGVCVARPTTGCSESDCPLPVAPILEPIAEPALTFTTAAPLPIQVRWDTLPPEEWIDADTVPIGAFVGRAVQVRARVHPSFCAEPPPEFEHTYLVTGRYPGPPGTAGSDAVAHDDSRVLRWASAVTGYTPGPGVAEEWRDPARALGPASATPFDVVSLGEGGHIVLDLDQPIGDAEGYELAVFENAFDDRFLELARVSVSSDGVRWATFDTATHATTTPDPWRMLDVRDLGGFAGRFEAGWGTPFDLSWLRHTHEVQSGRVDLQAVRWVRVEDLVGDGREADSFGRPVVDPWPSVTSAGFDLDAVAVMGRRPSR